MESLILLPITTISLPFGSMPKVNPDIVTTPQVVLSQKLNTADEMLSFNQEADQKAKILKIQADAIDTYFKEHDMPLAGTGMKMALEADKNGLDYRLLPAITARESTGGRHACKNATYNSFGWGSCKISFDSNEEAIETIAKHLGGKVETTAKHYAEKTTKEILQKYNPPSIVPHYADQVMRIMADIGEEDVAANMPQILVVAKV